MMLAHGPTLAARPYESKGSSLEVLHTLVSSVEDVNGLLLMTQSLSG